MTSSIALRTAACAALALGLPSTAGCAKKPPADAPRPAGLPASPGAPPSAAPAPTPPPPPPPAGGEAEMVPAAPDPKASISGTITLPAARKKDVSPSDIVFIIARRSGGAPGPGSMLAAQKHPVSEFPIAFTLSGRDAMIPGIPFEGPVSITVRLDKDGDAMTRKKGDLFGQVNDIKVGTQGVTIPLDSIQREDHTLGGGAPMGAAPAGGRQGMPPGHP